MSQLKRIVNCLFRLPDLSLDERRKRMFLSLSILVTVPVTTVYGLIDYFQDRCVEGLCVVGLGGLLVIIFFLFRYLKSMVMAFRCCGALVFSLFAYETAVGGGEGYAFVWFYFFPIALFFLFGVKEGLVWGLATLVLIAILLFLHPHTFVYGLSVSIRFFLTYFIVAIISCAFEVSREYYYSELLNEKRALEIAIQKVRTLSGLLPLCSHCKKIRDGEGAWKQVDEYISEHSDADVSHGVCPECADKYYPDLDIYGKQRARS